MNQFASTDEQVESLNDRVNTLTINSDVYLGNTIKLGRGAGFCSSHGIINVDIFIGISPRNKILSSNAQ